MGDSVRPVSLPMRLIVLVSFLFTLISIVDARKMSLMCMQCGGENYEQSVRLSRESCCKATPVMCQAGQVCLRALVYSPYGNFFLSGCHPEEDHLSGCDYHTLPHNSSVHRCVCKDDECQNDFPGDCPIEGMPDMTRDPPTTTTTTRAPAHSSTPPSLLARNRTRNNSSTRGRHHHNHSMSSSSSFSSSSFFSLISRQSPLQFFLFFVWVLVVV